ncbi:hypothetical protein LEMLEM_LOCUS391, partial [Lemmus lemmus]
MFPRVVTSCKLHSLKVDLLPYCMMGWSFLPHLTQEYCNYHVDKTQQKGCVSSLSAARQQQSSFLT